MQIILLNMITTLQKKCPIKIDFKGGYYLKITFARDYNKVHSDRSL